ncbi:MAG: hypothetical protein ACREN1_08625 [Candidatus Dormibacteria bacterium]
MPAGLDAGQHPAVAVTGAARVPGSGLGAASRPGGGGGPVIVMAAGATAEQIRRVVQRGREMGLTPQVSHGRERTIVGLAGPRASPIWRSCRFWTGWSGWSGSCTIIPWSAGTSIPRTASYPWAAVWNWAVPRC